MGTRTYRMPFGPPHTQNIKEYAKAWEDLAKPICELTGAELHGFDPDVQIVWRHVEGVEQARSKVISFPPSFLRELNKALANEGVIQHE